MPELANVHEFKGRFAFLSNFWREASGYTVEHKFQAAKTNDPMLKSWVLAAHSPGEAKRRGRKVTLREDWEKVKFDVMLELVRDKFYSDPRLARQLLETGNATLYEGNSWHDTYWGVDIRTGKGVNALGKILMQVRGEIAADTEFRSKYEV